MPDLVVGDQLYAVHEVFNDGIDVYSATVTAVSEKRVRISGGGMAFRWRTVLSREEAGTFGRNAADAYAKYVERALAEISRLELRRQKLQQQIDVALAYGK